MRSNELFDRDLGGEIVFKASTGFKNPSPYFDEWLTIMFGDELGRFHRTSQL